jgi:hypothetical protein
MEASHLGVAFRYRGENDLDDAIRHLSAEPRLPNHLRKILSSGGQLDPALRDRYHAWWCPAVEIYRTLGSHVGDSLALPTWYYGHETFTPFATRIGKFFQNSVREDGLVTFCTAGVVYTPGSAGTLQEIFQDAAQNYYRSVANRFSPMIFWGIKYWSENLAVLPLLRQLVGDSDFNSNVLVTDSEELVVERIMGQA